jgi:hypothetical protein
MSALHPYQAIPGTIERRRRRRHVLVVAVDGVVPDGLAHADVDPYAVAA